MSVPVDNSPPQAPAPRRRFLTRAEVATLLGMALTVFSLFLIWQRTPVTPLPGALYTDLSHVPAETFQTGFATSACWPLTFCAALCGATLLWMPTEKTRLPLAFAHVGGALGCVLIALHWWARADYALRPGVLAALLGGALLTFGAAERFTGTKENT